jgi:hypothetical protein
MRLRSAFPSIPGAGRQGHALPTALRCLAAADLALRH